MTPVSSRCN